MKIDKNSEWEVIAKDGNKLTMVDTTSGEEFDLEVQPEMAERTKVGAILRGTIKGREVVQ
jgi:hypothetical protein